MFCIYSQEGTSSSHFCLYCKTHFNMEIYDLGSTASIPLQWYYHFNYKICLHISIFFTCQCQRYFINNFAHQKMAAPVKYSNPNENKCIIMALVCYTTVVLNLTMVLNQSIVRFEAWTSLHTVTRQKTMTWIELLFIGHFLLQMMWRICFWSLANM